MNYLVQQVGEASVDREGLVHIAEEWLGENRGNVFSPKWAEERDRRRWRQLIGARTPEEWLPLLERFVSRKDTDGRWTAIRKTLLVKMKEAGELPPLEKLGVMFENATPEMQVWERVAWRREEQQRQFLVYCCKFAEIRRNEAK